MYKRQVLTILVVKRIPSLPLRLLIAAPFVLLTAADMSISPVSYTHLEQILKVHMRRVPLAPDIDAAIIARGTPGFSGADLANLVNEAALLDVYKRQDEDWDDDWDEDDEEGVEFIYKR